MHPIHDNLKAEIVGARNLLQQPAAEVDETLRKLLAERFYVEKQQRAILEWLPRIEQQIEQVAKAHADELAARDRRIAELEAELAARLADAG